MSLFDTYKDVSAKLAEDKPKLFRLLDEHIVWDELIPARFYQAFYQRMGRSRSASGFVFAINFACRSFEEKNLGLFSAT